MPHRVLNEDWSAYDNRKIRDKRDRSRFSCEERWEVDYLVKLMQKHFTHKSEHQIRAAIASCCQAAHTPRLRKEFVECVIHRLN